MIFLSNANGTITAAVPTPLYQGSSQANEVVLIGPFSSSSVVSVVFRLPNGQILKPRLAEGGVSVDSEFKMTELTDFANRLYDNEGTGYRAWRLELDAAVTAIPGPLTIQFFVAKGFTDAGKPIILSTSSITIDNGTGVDYIPVVASEADWEEITAAVATAQRAAVAAAKATTVIWNLIITDINNLNYNYLNEQLKGITNARAYVAVDLSNQTVELSVPENVILIDFGGCSYYNTNITVIGDITRTTHIRNLYFEPGGDNQDTIGKIIITDMAHGEPCGCGAEDFMRNSNLAVEIENCDRVSNGVVTRISACSDISNVIIYAVGATTYEFSGCVNINNIQCIITEAELCFDSCRNISNVFVYHYSNRSGVCIFDSCTNISNIRRDFGTGSNHIQYIDCDGVVGASCDDYYNADDIGKVPVITENGTKDTFDPSTKLDKVTTPFVDYSSRVYAIDGVGTQTLIKVDYSESASENAIPLRRKNVDGKKNRNIYLPDFPHYNTDSANKGYVDGEITTVEQSITTLDNRVTNVKTALETELQALKDSVTGVYQYQGSVVNYSDLPTKTSKPDLKVGDVYNVVNASEVGDVDYPAGTNFAWDGEKWDALGGDLDALITRIANLESALKKLEESTIVPLETRVDTLEDKSAWDYVITSIEDLTNEKLATMSGNVLVKDLNLPSYDESRGEELIIPSAISYIKFVNCETRSSEITIKGYSVTTIEGLRTGVLLAYDTSVTLTGFYRVKNCRGENLHIHDCQIVEECYAFRVLDCDYVNRFEAYTEGGTQHWQGDCTIENCKCVTNVEIGTDTEDEPIIDLLNCEYVSNVYGDGIVHYQNCKHVDGDTCKDYYTAEEVGQVQAITADGSKATISVYSQEEINEKIGDIDTALDSIIAIQESLIGGDAQ